MLHRLRGFQEIDSQDNIVSMMLKGADHLILSAQTQPYNNRRAMTLPLLRHFGHMLSTSDWHPAKRQCLWTAGLLAFFGTIRMGELLSPTEKQFDTTCTLTWGDIHYRDEDDSFLIHLKIPKTAPKQGEFVDIFKFPKFGCCPVAALKKHRVRQLELGKGGRKDPVFTLPEGKLATTSMFNSSLKILMKDICDFQINSISGHSFKAGVPSELNRHPELLSQDDIKGWGRWNSDAYQRYTRLHLDQKKSIFQRITAVLN